MAIWVAAGIAALVAFIGAHALDDAPKWIPKLIFSIAILAGVALAFAHVGFEWNATVLQRKMDADKLLDQPLTEEYVPWPWFPERCWEACGVLIIVAWALMLLGIWKSRPVPDTPTTRADLETFSIGTVGSFADCSAGLPADYDAQITALIQNYRNHVAGKSRAAVIILTGIADNHRLSAACARLVGDNAHLAALRAGAVRAVLEPRLATEHVPPKYVLLTSGPKHLEAKTELDGRKEDRAVEAWVSIDFSSDASVKP